MLPADSAGGWGRGRQHLLDEVRDAIKLRHYSASTAEAYVGWVRAKYWFRGKRHPSTLSEPDCFSVSFELGDERGERLESQSGACCVVIFVLRGAAHQVGLAG